MNTASRPLFVGFAGVGIGVVLALRLLGVSEWDPAAFAAFGEDAATTTQYAEERLRRGVPVRIDQGHDGKFFFVQAHDPLVLHPDTNAAALDRPRYRSQRMLYPLIAGLGGTLPSESILWGLVVVNVVALGVGSWGVARIAETAGLSPWFGLAFALNFALFSEMFIDGAGIVAFALAVVGCLALQRERPGLAMAAMTGAVLTREVMILFVAFAALGWWVRKRAVPWAFLLVPASAVGLWALYLRTRIDVAAGSEIQEITVVPFSGMVQALTSGHALASDVVVAFTMVALAIVVPLRAIKSDVYLSWGAVGFAVLAPFLTEQVWQKSFDISRALAPLLTVFVLELFRSRAGRKSQHVSESSEQVFG